VGAQAVAVTLLADYIAVVAVNDPCRFKPLHVLSVVPVTFSEIFAFEIGK
jgi:hypothetical protein